MERLKIISYSFEPFEDRKSAGVLLAKHLQEFVDKFALVLGIPRGGVIIAGEIAKALNADLDVILTRKLGAPYNPELAIGAISEDGNLYVNKRLATAVGADKDFIAHEKEHQMAEIEYRSSIYRKIKTKVSAKDRIVIITDDGVATGATMLASLWSLKQEEPKRLIVAIPVGAKDSVEKLTEYADEVIVLQAPKFFAAIGQFYLNFEQTNDEQVIEILKSVSLLNKGVAHETRVA